MSVFGRRPSSDKNLQVVESGQYLVEVVQTLTKFFKLLHLLYTDRLQQFEDFYQSLFYFYYILTAFNNLKIFVRGTKSSNCSKMSVFGRRPSSDKNLQVVESGQYLVEVVQTLTKKY
jgi:hypothetical protein